MGKSLKIIAGVLFLTLGLISNQKLIAQCQADQIAENCINELDSNYHFLKSYSLMNKSESVKKAEFSYVLTENTSYTVNICSSQDSLSSITLHIFDENRNLVASNEEEDSTLNMSLDFTCSSTGIYYLQFNTKDDADLCGGGILAFKNEE